MRKNMRKLTMAAAVSAISITALCPATAQAKGDTLTVAIWDNGQKAGLEKLWRISRKRQESRQSFR